MGFIMGSIQVLEVPCPMRTFETIDVEDDSRIVRSPAKFKPFV
jgi:hypothetical protein